MPPLSNPRHERYAQELAKGKSKVEAYEEAGYSRDRGNAVRLTANDSVQKRLAELFDATIPDINYDRKAINNIYTGLLIEAKKKQNLVLAKGLADSIARVNGLIITRHETGKAGEFENLSDSELIEIIASPLGDSLDVDGESGEE